MNRKMILYAAAVALAAGCGQSADKASGTAAETIEQVKTVETMVAGKQIVPQNEVYSSTVQANIINNIAPQSAGRILKINVEIGDYVSKGQILAEMDDVQLVQAELKLRNAEDELVRVRRLLEEGGISQSDFDQLELSYKVARRSYDNLLENTILRSPVDGVVTARNYDTGDLYAMAQPIFTVQQITPVKALVAISETDYTKVKVGDRVDISADALPGKVFSGRIVRVYPTMDAGSHTFNAEVQVRNERRELRPGMFIRATVNFGANNSIVVPDVAVLKQQGSGVRTVMIMNAEGIAESRVVTLGRHTGLEYEILEGLSVGDKVIVKGQASLKVGAKVEEAVK